MASILKWVSNAAHTVGNDINQALNAPAQQQRPAPPQQQNHPNIGQQIGPMVQAGAHMALSPFTPALKGLQSDLSAAKAGVGLVTGNKVAAHNAFQAAKSQYNQSIDPARGLVTRPAAELATSLAPRQVTYHPGSAAEKAIFGNTPIQNIQKKTINNYQTHPNLNVPARVGLAAGEAGLSIAQDAPVAGGALKAAKVAAASDAVKTAKAAAADSKVGQAVAPKYAGLPKKQIIMDTSKLDTLNNAKQILTTNSGSTAIRNQVNQGLHDIKNQHGLDFITGSRAARVQRLNQYLEKNGEAIPQLQAKMAQPRLKPLGQVGGGAINDSPIRKALQGDTSTKPPSITSPEQALSKFPNRLLEEDRTAPIHQTLVNLATHEVKHNQPVLDQTAANIAKNEDQALTFAKRGSSTEANATAMQLLDKYLSEGQSEKADDLVKSISPRFTRQGQETQILAAYSKLTPAGAVRYANRQVEKAIQNTPKGTQLEDATAQAHGAIKNTAQDVANQLETEIKQGKVGRIAKTATVATEKEPKTPEQMLADRIKTGVSQKKQGPDPIKDMVDTLHKVAKEVIPEQLKKNPRNPMELIGKAIKDKAQYKDVWEKAQKLVAEKYKDNPHALEELDKYFSSSLARPFSKGQLDRGVRQGLKGVDLSKIVKQHYTKVDETGQELRDKLIEQAGLGKGEATQLASDIQNRYGELVQGRKDSILKQMFGDRPTPEQVSAADRILTLHNLGAMGRDELRPLVAKKLGLESLSPDAASRISNMAGRIQTLAEGSPERTKATAAMMKFIADQVPQTAANKALSVWKAGLLSGVKTHTGNALSNSTFGALHTASNPLATGIDKLISLKTGERTKTLTGRGIGSGVAQGAKEGLNTLKTGIDTRNIIGGKYEVHGELNFKNPLANNLVAKPTNAVFRAMSAGDQPFYYSAYQNNLADLAKADGINKGLKSSALDSHIKQTMANPTPAMQETATLAAQKSVLGQDNKLAAGLSKFAQSHPAAQVVVPFTKVPTNFLSRTLDYTPVGAINTVVSQVRAGKLDQRALSEALSEATTGSGLIYLGSELANHQMLSGQYPTDPKEQQRWKAEGITPNSVKISSKWVSMNYLGPAGIILQAGKDYHDALASGDDRKAAAIAATMGVGKSLTGQSFLTGFSGFANALNDPGRYGKNLVNQQAGSLVPNLINDAANATDPLQRETNNVKQAIESRIPIIRRNLPVKQDVYGNPLNQRTNPADLTADPLRPSNAMNNKNPVVAEVARLHGVDPNNKDLQVTPEPIKKKFTVDGQNITLNDQQVHDLQNQVGQYTQQQWGKLIGTKQYQAMSDLDKANALNKLRQDASTVATRQYVTTNSLAQYKKAATAKQLSLATDGNVGQYLSSSKAASSADLYKAPDAEYKALQAKYQDNLTNNRFSSPAAKIKAENALAQAKVGASFDKNVRDLYGLNKSELTYYMNTDPNGKALVDKVIAYGDAQQAAGFGKNKFRNSKGAVSLSDATTSAKKSSGPKVSKSGGSRSAKLPKLQAIKTPKLKTIKSPSYKVAKLKSPKMKTTRAKIPSYAIKTPKVTKKAQA